MDENEIKCEENKETNTRNEYKEVDAHWFYFKKIENKQIWVPFSKIDSNRIESNYLNCDQELSLPTDGGRYDVYPFQRIRKSVYWDEETSQVRRCTWFYKKDNNLGFIPYEEDFSMMLESKFMNCALTNSWNQRFEFPDHELIVMYNSNSFLHYKSEYLMLDDWNSMAENPVRPRTMKRGLDGFDMYNGEPEEIDHLIFFIHGVGSVCDLKFRSIVEVVDDFRSISLSLVHNHYKNEIESKKVNRVEFLPVSWHSALHGENTGIDQRLELITLPSISKLRHFSNDTILDALLYTSPVYQQTVVDVVGSELNRLYNIFIKRNPSFDGSVALNGHSLGSVILFDILVHQDDEINDGSKTNLFKDIHDLLNKLGLEKYLNTFIQEDIDLESLKLFKEDDLIRLDIPLGPRKKLINYISSKQNSRNYTSKSYLSAVNYKSPDLENSLSSIIYPKLDFKPSSFFAMGSPISMFLIIRGVQSLAESYQLPTCTSFFNIFHPFDAIAYRFEPLVDKSFLNVKPCLVPHHKGRKRMHLELKESIARVGADLYSKVVDSFRFTWNSINDLTRSNRPYSPNQVVPKETNPSLEIESNDENDEESNKSESVVKHYIKSQLNKGHRIDYVLQEKPIEVVNEYLSALTSHTCYWESEDSALFILKVLYGDFYLTNRSQESAIKTNTE